MSFSNAATVRESKLLLYKSLFMVMTGAVCISCVPTDSFLYRIQVLNCNLAQNSSASCINLEFGISIFITLFAIFRVNPDKPVTSYKLWRKQTVSGNALDPSANRAGPQW